MEQNLGGHVQQSVVITVYEHLQIKDVPENVLHALNDTGIDVTTQARCTSQHSLLRYQCDA